MKAFLVVFLSVFLAELGDKTQVATLLFATDQNLNWVAVFAASSTALVFASLLAVLFGAEISRLISPSALKLVAGLGFVVIGIWMLIVVRQFRRGFNWHHLRGDMLTISKSLLPPSTEIFILQPHNARDYQ